MNYKNSIGERVLVDGCEGTIVDVWNDGTIVIQSDDSPFREHYMFDVFLNGDGVFLNPNLQKQVDNSIAELAQKDEEYIKAHSCSDKIYAEYTITLDNEDGTKEEIYLLPCEKEEAYSVFSCIIRKQARVYKRGRAGIKWRVVRLWDKAGHQIAQES